MTDESTEWFRGTILLLVGAVYIFFPIYRSRKAVENIFAGRTENLTVEMTTGEDAIQIKTPGSTGTISWANLVDCRICDGGILLYPQKTMHFWIPDSAKIENGTWEEFTDLVSSKITRKI